jgi:hypothetical protein
MIQTRSPLVTRDCDLFQELRERGVQVVVGVTLSTDREEVRKIFEPQCASIPRRLATLTDLHAWGFLTQASLSPLLPCNPSVLAEMVAPYCDWMTVQPLHALGGGARTWTPAIELVKMHGWEDWLEGGPAVADAMASLQAFFGPSRFHVAEEGFSLGWLK